MLNVINKKNIAELDSVLQRVLRVEADALVDLSHAVPSSISDAVNLIHASSGPLIVSGVGKSGHIARKIASTFRSLGKRSAFLHAAEASHGDLGIIHDDSIVLVLSNSGETIELADLLAFCRENKIPIIGITASSSNTLGRSSQIVIAHGNVEEACINGLAPTTSTTLALAIGDALAVGVSHLSSVEPRDFRRYHPGGKLGARLLTVGELMHTGDALPIVSPDIPMQEVVITMSAKGFGVALVVDNDQVLGLISDGDMRRNVTRLWQSKAKDLVLGPPQTVSPDLSATQALEHMSNQGITCVVVIEEAGKVLGLLHIHDCIRAGVQA